MTSGCLGLCVPEEQTVAFFPNDGQSEIFTTTLIESEAKREILEFIKSKI